MSGRHGATENKEKKSSKLLGYISQLRPNSWKSDSHLNQKQVNRCKVKSGDSKDGKELITKTKPLSKSSDWTDVALEVPERDEAIHLHNPKLSLIFDNEKTTPVPPPRKHKKGFREKLEAVAKNGLQAFQSKKPVEEPLCVKRTVNPTCPLDDHDCAIHNRDHRHEPKKNDTNDHNQNETPKQPKLSNKEAKRRKNLSVVSLPNYNELKLTVATFDDIDKKPERTAHGSIISLPGEPKKITTTTSTGKLDICMTRCRSFGSLLPQQLLDKWRVRKIPTDIESDDSFGGLEDWDLRIIEHYNPKDTSLPRPRKLKNDSKEVLGDIESLIVKEEDAEPPRPVAPVRRSESLLKKINREAAESARKRSGGSPEKEATREFNDRSASGTPPPSPQPKMEDDFVVPECGALAAEENGVVEHSSLMKILEKFSMEDKLKSIENETFPELATDTGKPSVQLEKDISSVQDFLNSEKLSTSTDLPIAKFGKTAKA